MCVYTATIATILAVTLWHIDSEAALKYNDYKLNFSLARRLDKGSAQWRVTW